MIQKLNQKTELVNADLKHLFNWLNANKTSLNVKKTEMVIFKSKQKKLEGDLKIKLCVKRLYPTESVKYLGVKIDANLTWQHHGLSGVKWISKLWQLPGSFYVLFMKNAFQEKN